MSEDPHAPVAWFELASTYGIDHAGNLEPLCPFVLNIAVPQMGPGGMVLPSAADKTPVALAAKLDDSTPIRVIPDTRIIETSDLRLAAAVLALGVFDQIDKPSKAHIDKARKETAAHHDAMSNRGKQIAAADIEPPGINDPKPEGDAEETNR